MAIVSSSTAQSKLGGVIYHDDRKSLARWVRSQRKYAEQEIKFSVNASPHDEQN